ncbi:MAG: DUF309 domain-containing protein [Limisphaerales bacterium]
MSHKSPRIAKMIESLQGQSLPAHYLGYFECFNRQQFYEAHDVLEELWLAERKGPNYAFYKGLIQFAGAFVHLQRHSEKYPRLRPSAALFKLSRANLQEYPPVHEQLDLAEVLALIETWLEKLDAYGYQTNPLHTNQPPTLRLSIPPQT